MPSVKTLLGGEASSLSGVLKPVFLSSGRKAPRIHCLFCLITLTTKKVVPMMNGVQSFSIFMWEGGVEKFRGIFSSCPRGGVWRVGPPGGCFLKHVLPVQVPAQEGCGLMLEVAC